MFTRKIDRRTAAAVFAINSCSCGAAASELVRVAPVGDLLPFCAQCASSIQFN